MFIFFLVLKRYSFYRCNLTAICINIKNCTRSARLPARRLKFYRCAASLMLYNKLRIHSQHSTAFTAHTDIGYISRAAR